MHKTYVTILSQCHVLMSSSLKNMFIKYTFHPSLALSLTPPSSQENVIFYILKSRIIVFHTITKYVTYHSFHSHFAQHQVGKAFPIQCWMLGEM